MGIQFVPEGKVEIPQIQYSDNMELEAGNTALLIIDMQNDFVKPDGNLNVPDAEDTVPRIRQLLQSARDADLHVAYTQDTQVQGDPEFEIWPPHCVEGSWGWQIIDELKPRPGDLVCKKNRYDGFYGSWLDHFLCRIWGVKKVVIVGTASNICVLHTAASAGLRYFHIVVPANGISALTTFDQALTLHQASTLYAGTVVRDTADLSFSG